MIESAETQSGPLEYRSDIDGLRAVAVIAVILYHAFPFLLPNGLLGVDVFFVISGYLITGIVESELRQKTFRVSTFYARRIRRIVPTLLVVIAVSLLIGWRLMLPTEYAQLGEHAIAAVLFVSNIQYWSESGYFDKAAALKPLLHLWSLSVEEQFYLVWPLLLMYTPRRLSSLPITIFVIAILSFCTQALLSARHPDAAFYFTFARAWELMLGAALAAWHLNRKAIVEESLASNLAASPLGLILILASVSVGSEANAVSTWWRLLPTFGTCLIIGSGPNTWFNRSVLGCRSMVLVGKLSYPLYLWHWPLLSFLQIDAVPGSAVSVWPRIAAIGASIGLAWLTYTRVEWPIRFGQARRQAVPALCAILMVIGAFGLVDVLGEGFPSRFPESIRKYISSKYDFAKGARVGKCWLTSTDPADGFSPECFRNTGAKKSVLLWGDSHAGRLYVGLSKVYGDDFDIEQLTRDSCPPLLNFGYQICASSNEAALSIIKETQPDVILLFAAWDRYSSDILSSPISASIIDTLNRLHEIGVKRIVVIGPPPQWDEELPKVLARISKREIWAKTLPKYTGFELRNEIFAADSQIRGLAKESKSEYVSLIDMLCKSGECLTRATDGSEGLYTADYGHMTTAGAEYVARRLSIEVTGSDAVGRN